MKINVSIRVPMVYEFAGGFSVIHKAYLEGVNGINNKIPEFLIKGKSF